MPSLAKRQRNTPEWGGAGRSNHLGAERDQVLCSDLFRANQAFADGRHMASRRWLLPYLFPSPGLFSLAASWR